MIQWQWLLRLDVWLLVLAFIVPARKTFLFALLVAACLLLYRLRATTSSAAPPLTSTQLCGALIATLSAAALVRIHCFRRKATAAERARNRSRSHSFRFKRPGSSDRTPPGISFSTSRAATTASVLPPAAAAGPATTTRAVAASSAAAPVKAMSTTPGDAAVAASASDDAVAADDAERHSAAPTGADAPAGAGAGAGAGSGAPAAAPAEGEAAVDDPRKVVTIPLSELPLALPRGVSVGGEHCFSRLDGTNFKVRGANYKRDRVKVPSKPSICELVHVDLFKAPERVGSLATHPDSYIQQAIAAGDKRFFICVTFQRVHLSLYYAMPVDGPDSVGDRAWARLWKQFVGGDDEFRNSRWKVIPSIAEGNWIVRRSVGSKPALLGTKLTHEWSVGKQYLDISVDVASSSMASVLVGLLQQYAKLLVIDLAFVIQGEEGELPEHVLGTVRLSRPDLSRAVSLTL